MGMRPPFETFTRPTCRGCYALGTACGSCEKCVWERAQLAHNQLASNVCAHKWVFLRSQARELHWRVSGDVDIFYCEKCLERREVETPRRKERPS